MSEKGVQVAALNLRIAGVSERRIYETLKGELKDFPSYGQLRSWFTARGVRYREDATARRHAGRYYKLSKGEKIVRVGGSSRYFQRRRAQFTPRAKARLERNMAVGYLLREKVPAKDFKDDSVVNFIESDYETGSP